jgi:hypothetical protein
MRGIYGRYNPRELQAGVSEGKVSTAPSISACPVSASSTSCALM